MTNIIDALIAAFRSIFNPKMIALVLWPMLLAAGGWLFLAIIFWHTWMHDLSALLHAVVPAKWLANSWIAGASEGLMWLILVILLTMAVHLTGLVITAIFAMPIIVEHTGKSYYPELEKKKGGTFAGSLANTIIALVIYLVLLVISLPFWLFPPLALILPAALTAYLNQRLFRYDALAEHASAAELKTMAGHASAPYFILGIIAGLVQLVPVLNLFLPVYMGLAFSHLCLGQLERIRARAG